MYGVCCYDCKEGVATKMERPTMLLEWVKAKEGIHAIFQATNHLRWAYLKAGGDYKYAPIVQISVSLYHLDMRSIVDFIGCHHDHALGVASPTLGEYYDETGEKEQPYVIRWRGVL